MSDAPPYRRTTGGRFAPGTRGGPGRKPVATERTYLATLAAVVTADRWRAIVEAAADQAEGGDHAARQWLSRYLLGDSPPKLSRLTADDSPPDGDKVEGKGETAEDAEGEGNADVTADAEAAADAVLRDIWQKADDEMKAACRKAGLVPADPTEPDDDETEE